MLQRLGSWLRAAGYDTEIETDSRDDYELLKQAIAEQRKLITRDRKLLEYRRAPDNVVYLDCNTLEECVASLTRQLSIDWQYRPFSRCLVCNTELVSADEQQRQRIPDDALERTELPLFCPTCNKVYWEGSHVRRMRNKLQHWHQAAEAGEFD